MTDRWNVSVIQYIAINSNIYKQLHACRQSVTEMIVEEENKKLITKVKNYVCMIGVNW